MSIVVRANVSITAPDDAAVDQILRELASHHLPERDTYVSVSETSREFSVLTFGCGE